VMNRRAISGVVRHWRPKFQGKTPLAPRRRTAKAHASPEVELTCVLKRCSIGYQRSRDIRGRRKPINSKAMP
jgi:hypothetical protein